MTVISGTPAFIQVATELRSQIESGELQPDSKLPSSSELRAQYSVSNTVIRDAINELRRAGLVVGQQGKGVFVASPARGAVGASPDALAARVLVLEDHVNSLEEDRAQDLRDQVADLRDAVIDLYRRLGFPIPAKLAGSDEARTTDPVALSFPIPLKGNLSRPADGPEDSQPE
jgi:GntR family transcriptional regulator